MRSLGFCFGVLFLFVAIQVNAQSIIITDIDGSSFPVMNANLKVLDNEGNRVAVDEQSITLVEDGKPCQVRVRYCDPGGMIQRLSASILVQYLADSNGPEPQIIRRAGSRLIRDTSELLIASCGFKSDLSSRYYTTDVNTLDPMLDAVMAESKCRPIVEAINGQLALSDSARHRPIVILFLKTTEPLDISDDDVLAIIRRAYLSNATIYAIEQGTGQSREIDKICQRTRGIYTRLLSSTPDELESALSKILDHAQRTAPCIIEWLSPDPCSMKQHSVAVSMPFGVARRSYTPDPFEIHVVDHEPFIREFVAGALGTIRDSTVTIYARRGRLRVDSATSSNQRFSILGASFVLEEGESRDITVRYAQTDSAWSYSMITLWTNACPYVFTVYGNGVVSQYEPYRPHRIVAPRSRDSLIVGDSVDIIWVGGLVTDTVILSYRTSSSSEWLPISSSATGGRHRWRVPIVRTDSAELKIQASPGSHRSQMVAQTQFEGYSSGYGDDVGLEISGDGSVAVSGEGQLPFQLRDSIVTAPRTAHPGSFVTMVDRSGEFRWLSYIHPVRWPHNSSSLCIDDSSNVHAYGANNHYRNLGDTTAVYLKNDSLDLHHRVIDQHGKLKKFDQFGSNFNELYGFVLAPTPNLRYEVAYYITATTRGNTTYSSPGAGTLIERTNHLGQIDWSLNVQTYGASLPRIHLIPDRSGDLIAFIEASGVTKIGDTSLVRPPPVSRYVVHLSPQGKILSIRSLFIQELYFDYAVVDPRGGCVISIRQSGPVYLDGVLVLPEGDSLSRLLHMSTDGTLRPIFSTRNYYRNTILTPRRVLDDGTVISDIFSPDSVILGVKRASKVMMCVIDSSGTIVNLRDDVPYDNGRIRVSHHGMILAFGLTKTPKPVFGTIVSPPDSLINKAYQFYVAKSPFDQHLNRNVVTPLVFSIDDRSAMVVRAEDITGSPGQASSIRLIVDSTSNTSVLPPALGWTARLAWNSSILSSIEQPCEAQGENCEIEVSGIWDQSVGLLKQIPTMITLGETDRGRLFITSFRLDSTLAPVRVKKLDGEITVTGLCEDPNVRLLIGTASSFSLAARPNPASTVINIELGLREPLTVSIELINEMGQTVVTFVDGQPYVKGLHLIGGDVSTIATGMYFLRVRSAKGTLTSRLAIVR